MVIGAGLIGKRFSCYKDNEMYAIYASGVSNSSILNTNEFMREQHLLTTISHTQTKKILVYFSTCSVYDETLSQSPYVLHKLAMEQIVSKHVGGYLIFRVSNPVGNTINQNTVFNYFIHHIKNKIPFTIWARAERNLIDLDDMYNSCDYVLKNQLFNNSIINIANAKNYSVHRIVETIETYLHIKAVYTQIDKASVPLIDISAILPVYKSLHIYFGENYLWDLLKKYFPIDELS